MRGSGVRITRGTSTSKPVTRSRTSSPIEAIDEQIMLRPRAIAGTLIASWRVAVRLPRKNGESESSVVTGARDAETSYVNDSTDEVRTKMSLNPIHEFSQESSINPLRCRIPFLGVSQSVSRELWQLRRKLPTVRLFVP